MSIPPEFVSLRRVHLGKVTCQINEMSGNSGSIQDNTNNAASNLASWEKHTKGIGSKLLQKFGFKGRLGANETGITKAIEVYVRPTNAGLGFGDVDAPKVTQDNHILGEIVAKKDTMTKKRKKNYDLEGIADAQGWKKQKYDSQKPYSQDIDEYLKELAKSTNEGTIQPMKIIDMRGQNVKIITNMADIAEEDWSDEDEAKEKEIPLLGAELLFNLGKIFDQEKVKYAQATKRANEERSLYQSYKEEIKSIKMKKESDKRQLRKMNIIMKILKELNAVASMLSPDELLSFENILQIMDTLRKLIEDLFRAGPQEFKLMGFMRIVSNILISLLSNITRLEIKQQSRWLHALNSNWQLLIQFFFVQDENALATDCKTAFYHAVDTSYLPFWRQFVSSKWDGCLFLDEFINIVSILQSTLTPTVYQQSIDHFLVPKLVSIVQNWKFLSGNTNEHGFSLHGILIPWLPLLKEKLQPTFPEVRRKLANSLRNWHPKDVTIISSIRPWIGVFDKGSLDNLLSRVVIPKLVDFFRDEVTINPANQDIIPFQCALAWIDILPSWQIDCLLGGEFFPKFIGVLITWLSQEDPDYTEISEWYSGWKTMLPSILLENDTSLCSKALALVLDIMQSRLGTEDGQEFSMKVTPVLHAMQGNNYYMLAKEFQSVSSFVTSTPTNPDVIKDHSISSSASTLKEILELLAEQNGLIFAPKFGKSVQGKPIWEFGKSQIYMSNDVVYVMRKTSEKTEWSAVSLADLLSISK